MSKRTCQAGARKDLVVAECSFFKHERFHSRLQTSSRVRKTKFDEPCTRMTASAGSCHALIKQEFQQQNPQIRDMTSHSSPNAHAAFINESSDPATTDASEIRNTPPACANRRSASPSTLRPPPPVAFTRRQSGDKSRCRDMSKSVSDFILSARQSVCKEIHATELCPVERTEAHASLWAALEDVFLQKKKKKVSIQCI